MPLPRIQRGELWLVDLGYLGKVRPVLVVSVPFQEHERTLCIVVPHTTSVIGTRFEVTIPYPALHDSSDQSGENMMAADDWHEGVTLTISKYSW